MIKMKKEYIVPGINVTRVDVESLLLSESNPDANGEIDYTKRHDSSFDDYWSWDEEEKPMFQQPKSLWD